MSVILWPLARNWWRSAPPRVRVRASTVGDQSAPRDAHRRHRDEHARSGATGHRVLPRFALRHEPPKPRGGSNDSGFTAHDYAGGKADWLAAGLPSVRQPGGAARPLEAADRNPSSCGPDDTLAAITARRDRGPVVVITDTSVVLGVLTDAELTGDPTQAAEVATLTRTGDGPSRRVLLNH